MKSVWLWVVFLLLYGVFSMKTHATGMVGAEQDAIAGSCGSIGSLYWSA